MAARNQILVLPGSKLELLTISEKYRKTSQVAKQKIEFYTSRLNLFLIFAGSRDTKNIKLHFLIPMFLVILFSSFLLFFVCL